MLFENTTKEPKKYRTGSHEKGYDWVTIRPGETKDMLKETGKMLKLTKVVEAKSQRNTVKKEPSKQHKPVNKDKPVELRPTPVKRSLFGKKK